MEMQKTIKKEVSSCGIGLHTGNKTTVTFKPAKANTGIRFIRTDLKDKPIIRAEINNVLGVIRGTTIGLDDQRSISTVEHLLAALYGLGIDNVFIEINSNEPPIGDGSSLKFVELLNEAGIVELNEPKNFLTLSSPVHYKMDNVSIVALPSQNLIISCTVEYNHPILKSQFASFQITPETFTKEIAPAKTFCFDHEIEALKKRGLAKGGTLENAIVIGEKKIHNENILKFSNEFVRHKILDLIGDLYLLGKPIKAEIIAVRCGHSHNIAFTRELSKFIPLSKEKEEKRFTLPEGKILDINQIKSIIPHRHPFLFIDKVIVVSERKRAVGIKNVSGNEDFFLGHFPQRPIMPGVLIIEAMAQTSCVLFLEHPEHRDKLAYFMGINDVKFRKPVLPGDKLILDVEVIRSRERGGKVKGFAYVEGNLVAEAEFMFALVDKNGGEVRDDSPNGNNT